MRNVMKASRIVAMDGFVRPVDLAYLAESALERGARLGLLHNSRRTCDWKMRVSDSPAHVEKDIMVQCRPGRSRAMIIAETPAKANELADKISKQALEQLSLGGAQYAKEKSVRFTNEGPVRVVSIDVSEEGAYKACDVLIATSALGAGVDFPEAHFDKIYGVFQAEPAQLEADDIVQLLFRVRKLRRRGEPPGGEHLLVAVRKSRASAPSVSVGEATAHWRESDDERASTADTQRYLDLKASHHGSRRAGMPTRRLAVAARLRLLSTCAVMNVRVTEDQGNKGPKEEKEQRQREIKYVLESPPLDITELYMLLDSWWHSRDSLAKVDVEKVAALARLATAAFLAKDASALTESDVAWLWKSFYSIPLMSRIILVLKRGGDMAEIASSTEYHRVSKVAELFKRLFGPGYEKLAGDSCMLWSDEAYAALASPEGREAYAVLQSLDERAPKLDASDNEKAKLAQQSWRVIQYLLEKYMGVRRARSGEKRTREGQEGAGSRKRKCITWVKEDTLEDVAERQARQRWAGVGPDYLEVKDLFCDCYSLLHRRI
eukprot:tig00021603_g22819.t1